MAHNSTIGQEVRPRRPETPLTDSSTSISSVASCSSSSTGPSRSPNVSASGKTGVPACTKTGTKRFDAAARLPPPPLSSTAGTSSASLQHGPNLEPTPDPSPIASPVDLYSPVPRRARHDLPEPIAPVPLSSPQLWSKSACSSTSQLWMPAPKRNNDGWLSRNTSQESLTRQGFMTAYPNSAPRHGGVSHFDIGESPSIPSPGPYRSGNNSPALIECVRLRQRHAPPFRRQSSYASEEWTCTGIGHTEEEEEQTAGEDGAANTEAVDADAAGDKVVRQSGISDFDEMATDSELDDMELELPEDALWITTKKRGSSRSTRSPLFSHDRTRGGTPSALLHSLDMPAVPEHAPLSTHPPRAGAHVILPRRRPTIDQDDHDEFLGGQDIVYTRCNSPETVHLETDQLYHKVCELEQSCRDKSGKSGLWGGYCFGTDNQPAIKGPKMLSTPRPEALPNIDPFAMAFAKRGTGSSSSIATRSIPISPVEPGLPSPGLHPPLLSRRTSLVQQASIRRAAQKVEEAIFKEKVKEEFTDHFVTQVYNYLSLGYPTMSRAYDQELAKITGVPVVELRRDDDELMASGHFVDEVDPEDEDDTPQDGPLKPRGREKTGEQKERCPRWKALQSYVHEWARQHPNLETLDPLVWGLQERRGSWAL